MINDVKEGVVTLADDAFFPGLILLYQSIQETYPIPVICFDAGLTDVQCKWAGKYMPLCEIKPFPDLEIVNDLKDNFEGISANDTKDWLLWVCPYLIAASPFQRTFWLDSDLVVLRHLGKLFQELENGPVFTRENHDPEATPNSPELYDLMPIDRDFTIDWPLVNAGVSGWDLERDKELLDYYQFAVAEAVRDVDISRAISWHDQGALIWALQKSGNEDRMFNSTKWNYCIKNAPDYKKDYSGSAEILQRLRREYKFINILHWNGVPLPEKLHSQLQPQADFHSITMNEYVGIKMPKQTKNNINDNHPSKIKLVSHIGINSNPVLIDQFFDHYTNLGVDEFLIILHLPVDNNLGDEVLRIMKSYNIVPWLIVETFSAALKFERCKKMIEDKCTDDDWILYADVDELQVYPDKLSKVLDHCDNNGYTFVRGTFKDRIAENGELAGIVSDISLWEQFPYIAAVTATITGGWEHKVCISKASRPVRDGGSHTLDYGVDGARNYHCTKIDPSAFPETINVHHFKWDATLLKRVENKVHCIDGDRDSLDGEEFMHEYKQLKDHLDKNGRIFIDSMQWVGIPELHYENS